MSQKVNFVVGFGFPASHVLPFALVTTHLALSCAMLEDVVL